MSIHIPKTSFQDLHEKFYIKHAEKLDIWLVEKLQNMFSDIKIRVLSAKLFNPPPFSCITLYADGHDNRINYNSIKEIDSFKRRMLYSYKLKQSGCRSQVMMDINNMFIAVSDTEKCGVNNDGSMFIMWKPDDLMNKNDVLQLDGGYTLFIKTLLKKQSVPNRLVTHNFLTPLRKYKNKDFDLSEQEYNEKFGSKRSDIETAFANLSSIFLRFSCNNKPRVCSLTTYNLQFKLACFLLNVRTAEKLFHLELQSHHQYWYHKDFDFESHDPLNDDNLTARLEDQLHYIEEMSEIQESFIQILANDSSLYDESDEDQQEEDDRLFQISSENDGQDDEIVSQSSVSSDVDHLHEMITESSPPQQEKQKKKIRYSPPLKRLMHRKRKLSTSFFSKNLQPGKRVVKKKKQ
jgi:hypothetical protein